MLRRTVWARKREGSWEPLDSIELWERCPVHEWGKGRRGNKVSLMLNTRFRSLDFTLEALKVFELRRGLATCFRKNCLESVQDG